MSDHRLSFARRIVLSFGAMMLLAVTGIFLFWYFGFPALGVAGAADQTLAQTARLLELTASQQHNAIESVLAQRRGDAMVIADDPMIANGLARSGSDLQREVLRIFERLQRAYPGAFRELRVVDATTRRILGSSVAGEAGRPFADASLLARASQPGVAEQVEQSSVAGTPVVVIARQIYSAQPRGSDRLTAVMLLSLDAGGLLQSGVAAESPSVSLPAASLVIGSDGKVLARYPKPVDAAQWFLGGDPVDTGFEGAQSVPDGRGGVVVAVYRHLQLGAGQRWTLVHYQGKDDALRGLRESVEVVAIMAVLLAALALLLIAIAAGHLTRPLQRLARSAAALGRGKLSERALPQAGDSREIVELAEAFNTMADSVEKSHLELESHVTERTLELLHQRDTAQRYLDIARVMLIALDRNGHITLVNRKAEEVLGHPEEDLLGIDWVDNFIPAGDRAAVRRAFDALMAGETEGLEGFENRIIPASGQVRIVAWSNTVLRDEAGRPMGTLSSGEDITERQQADARLKLAASVFTHAREGITITDAQGRIIEVNDTFSRVTGYSREEAIGQNPRILQSGRHGADFYAQMWGGVLEKGYWSGEVWNRRKNGQVYAELLTISVVRDTTGKAQNYVALFTDITPMKDHQRELEHIAHFDALTALPNRVLLADRLSQGLLQSQRRGKTLGVAFLDLDGFKSVNDHHGHDVGDHLLITLAQRLKAALREGDTLARIGGDEFVAVLVDLEGVGACEQVLERLLQAASDPVAVDDAVLQVSASIGVTLYPQDGSDADLLLRHADQAMYQAKQAGKNRYQLFDIAHDVASKTLRESLEHIRLALQRNEFVLHYQPKVNMRTGDVVGAEALIRWQHPGRGLLPPGMFLPAIEDHPLSIEVGEWVIASALSQMALWSEQGLDLPVSVNIGAHQLQQDQFADRVATLLAVHPRIPRYHLELEILETSALQDIAQVSEVMCACRALGVGFALDDFGTGYSSLTYLKRLPAEMLKIDQSFVRDMLTDADNMAIVQGVIGLAQAFGRKVIAEGVETIDLGELLLKLGCELAQGYGIARPMPAADIPGWVATWRPDARWTDFVLAGE